MNLDAIPAELRDRDQWVTWRLVDRDGKATKIPYRADGAGRASSTDASTWSTFDAAVAGRDALNADGIGFVFSDDDGLVGIDLDALDADAAAIIAALDSYTEASVSGRGAHVIVRASLNGHPRNRKGPLEVYDRGRYFVVTGNHMIGTPTSIEGRQEQLEHVLDHFLPVAETRAESVQVPVPVDLDDVDLIDKARAARNGRDFDALYAGHWEGRYGSQSEADLALCSKLAFWTGRDPDRIDRIFRSSGLYRDKWERDDYRNRTIDEAIAGCTGTYEPRAKVLTALASSSAPASSNSGGTDHKDADPLTSTLATMRADRVQMRSIEWHDRPHIQKSAFHLCAGPKGVGKGTWLSRTVARFTTGAFGDPRNVLIISSEDSMEVDSTPRLAAAGADLTRVTFITERIVLPRDVGRIRDLALAIGDVGAIVIDPVGNHLGGADTDKEGLVRHAIGDLNHLADELACAILGVRHISKSRHNGALAAVLGSTAWVDVPRAVLMFARDDEDEMIFHVQVIAGNRSGRGSGRSYRIELRDIDGLLEPVTYAAELGESRKDVEELLTNPQRPSSRSQSARELILDILETDGPQESDALDARVAHETGLAAKTVKNARTKLKDEGLVRVHPDKDETGAIVRWKVSRTLAERT